MPTPRTFSASAIGFATGLVTLLAASAWAAEPKECTVRPLLKPVKSLEALVTELGGLTFATSTGHVYNLRPDGLFTIGAENGEACEEPGTITYSGNSATSSCNGILVTDDKATQNERRLAVAINSSTTGLIIADQAVGGAYTPGIWEPEDKDGIPVWTSRWIPNPVFVEIIPGARDTTLFDAVKTKLLQPEKDACPLLFEGPPSTKPRTVSEIFYLIPRYAEAAKKVAEQLKSTIGKVEVKQWPGRWDYQVVVVVGDAVAKGAAAPPTPKPAPKP